MRGEDNFVEVTLGQLEEISSEWICGECRVSRVCRVSREGGGEVCYLNTEREHTVKNSVVSNSRYLGTKSEDLIRFFRKMGAVSWRGGR